LVPTIAWIIIVVGAFVVVFILGTFTVGAGWEPTSRGKVRKMLEMSGVGPSDVVYDLGSGDGRVVVEAARTFHARAVGIEADPLRVLISRLVVALLHLEGGVRVVWGNFYHADLREATVVTVFLSQKTNQKLKSKLIAELKPGTRVVSYVWTFEGWTPALRDDRNELSMYVLG
jgi:precorrin-6B methylase 2